jgi:hypothetical protein
MRYGLVAGWAWRAVRANLIGLPQQDRPPDTLHYGRVEIEPTHLA